MHLKLVYSGAPLKWTPLGPLLCVHGIQISGASGILPVGVVTCTWAGEHDEAAFSDLSVAV